MDKKILVVDDDHLVRRTIARILKPLGINVVQASNGDEALKMIRADEDIQLILSDLLMPVMDGAELARAVFNLIAAGRKLKFYLLTATPNLVPDDIAMDVTVVEKPFSIDELRAIVEENFFTT